MNDEGALTELEFTVSGRIARPCAEVYEAVADPEQLSRYFTTGGARGRLDAGSAVSWNFADFPGRFPVRVVEADAPRRLIVEWENEAAARVDGVTTVVFDFEAIDGGARTLVTITESSWRATPGGVRAAFGNCEGWTGMLLALKTWLEHGINLREGLYK